ncbi:hypothetical protein EV651_108278 [Kribbella sp. VKM Ac-2571]|uniref:hypothetical protein n=1 Tax=Kribbella sp. VKM Ac-2571 TaxID=2512222 RepID=UPI001060EE1E|nr:hypothetical protein [Kribbella sp. VKM Ac-2571]TDO59930.1 hypothetical protein EV651_108278 [Kribbella sp. VKM Ac-2571]
MPRSVLLAAYVAWPAGVLVLRLVMRVRTRCLVVTGLGCLVALVLATTATPTTVAVPLGLFLGGVVAAGGCLATARGVTFTFDQNTTYWEYDGKIPVGDRLVEILGALAAILGIVALALN